MISGVFLAAVGVANASVVVVVRVAGSSGTTMVTVRFSVGVPVGLVEVKVASRVTVRALSRSAEAEVRVAPILVRGISAACCVAAGTAIVVVVCCGAVAGPTIAGVAVVSLV
jgi:hypothetical protein